MTGFQDHFSDRADGYAKYRPGYPDALFDWLATLTPSRERAWDCATGSGQAVSGLARHFRQVVATDASPDQLRNARPLPNVEYRMALAGQSGLEPHSVDLVTVAQALHWFDHASFFAEVRRVARPGGILAVWMYNLMEIEPAIDRAIRRFYAVTVGAFWPGDRRYIDEEYRSIAIPFREQAVPAFAMEADWPLEHLAGYLRTWSAVARYLKTRGDDPVVALRDELAPLWGNADHPRRIRWPLSVRVAAISPA